MSSLSQVIKRSAASQRHKGVISSTDSFLERTSLGSRQAIEDLRAKRHAAHSSSKSERVQLIREAHEIKRQIGALENAMVGALPIEVECLEPDVREKEEQLGQVVRELKRCWQPIFAERRGEARERAQLKKYILTFAKVRAAFPDAQILDLHCLALLRNSNGLPALAPFDLSSARSEIRLNSWESIEILAGGRPVKVSESVEKAIHRQITKATGIKVGYSSGKKEARGIQLHTEFSLRSGVFPETARELIRRASKSTLFERVLILAEVENWEVRYDVSPFGHEEFKAKIEGEIVAVPRTDDPLIVGLKTVAKKPMAFLLGEFDVTPIENLVAREFAVRPKKGASARGGR